MELEGKDINFGFEIFKEIKKREKSYIKQADSYLCPKCNSVIQQTTAYVSLWMKGFSSGGGGEVKHYPFPFCPKCEGTPKIIRGTRYY